MPFEDVGIAKLDHHRALRTGFAEVILAEGKTARQVAGESAAAESPRARRSAASRAKHLGDTFSRSLRIHNQHDYAYDYDYEYEGARILPGRSAAA